MFLTVVPKICKLSGTNLLFIDGLCMIKFREHEGHEGIWALDIMIVHKLKTKQWKMLNIESYNGNELR